MPRSVARRLPSTAREIPYTAIPPTTAVAVTHSAQFQPVAATRPAMTTATAARMPQGAQPGMTLPATWTGGRTRTGTAASVAASACAVALAASERAGGVCSVTSSWRWVGSALISDTHLSVDHCARGHVDHERHGEEDKTGGDQGVDRQA